MASGFGIAIAAGLAGLGQGKVGAAACEAMARNPAARPAIQVALILGLAFIESLVLFTLVIIFAKVGVAPGLSLAAPRSRTGRFAFWRPSAVSSQRSVRDSMFENDFPGSILLFGSGMVGLAAILRRKLF